MIPKTHAFSPLADATPAPRRPRPRRAWAAVGALVAAALVSACGGGGGDDPPVSGSCTVPDQQAWLRDYMQDWYFWYAISPNPSPANYSSVDSYFSALLYRGGPQFPADRYSNFGPTEDFNLFFGDGKTLGFGVRVAGLETGGFSSSPLYIRAVDSGSPAEGAGLVRGDEILSINGVSASTVIASGDFSALSPLTETDTLDLRVRTGSGAVRTLSLAAEVYDVGTVSGTSILTSPLGRRIGYVQVENMVTQVRAPLATAFTNFVNAGVSELVLDLRYNGGGFVSVGADVASYVTGARAANQVYASLLYNDKRAVANNEEFRFGNPAQALGLSRVYVLAGPRTCSASEQVVNGLRPFVDVVLIGDTTCGKPVGFLPEDYCGQTYSVVNFESVNADNEGRYFDGLAPTCTVPEDFTVPQGSLDDPLLAVARSHVDTGSCVAAGARSTRALGFAPREAVRRGAEPGERQGMMPR